MAPWTAKDIVDQSGRVAIVTGANSGIGFHTALELARRGARVVIAGRSEERGRAAVTRIRSELPAAGVERAHLDLADLASVRDFASHSGLTRLDLLINNAGVMMLPRTVTADGFEMQFGTNHLGHFALTGLLLPSLLATPGARVVTLSSGLHHNGRINLDDLMGERGYNRTAAYAQSKLANLLFTFELQRRLGTAGADLLSVAAHPGFAATKLGTGMGSVRKGVVRLGQLLLAQSAAKGALPTLYAATGPDVRGGEYFGPSGPEEQRGYPRRVQASALAHDQHSARELWRRSEDLTGVHFDALGAPRSAT